MNKDKREPKTVSQVVFRFQFTCDSYRKCKLVTDFSKLEDVVNYVHNQFIKRRPRNSQNNMINSMIQSKSPKTLCEFVLNLQCNLQRNL